MQSRILSIAGGLFVFFVSLPHAHAVKKNDAPKSVVSKETTNKRDASIENGKPSPKPSVNLAPKPSEPVATSGLGATLVPPSAAEPKPRSNWLLGFEFAPALAVSSYQQQNQYQPLFLFQGHVSYDFTNHQCFTQEKKDSVFCPEALVMLQMGIGYLASSDVPFFRSTIGFEFDFYFGHQRTVALSLKWRMGYGRYAIKDNGTQEQTVAENVRVPDTESKDRLEWGIGPGVLFHLGRFSQKAQGVSVYFDLHVVSSLYFAQAFALGAQYRF